MNNCSFVGRLTRDPDFGNGGNTDYARFSLAVNNGKKNSEGKTEADFFDFVSFGPSAKFVNEYFHKGDIMAVTAEAKQDRWEDKEGNKRSAISFVTRNINFVPTSSTKKDASPTTGSAKASQPEVQPANNDEEIPF